MPGTPQTLTLVATAESLSPATKFIRRGAREANLPELQAGQLELLIEEIFTNICRYSYAADAPGGVTISYFVPGLGEMKIEVRDQGVEFNPLKAPAPNLTPDLSQRQIGGLGILLLKSLARSLRYRRERGSNHLSFEIFSQR